MRRAIQRPARRIPSGPRTWTIPLRIIEWACEWIAYILGKWAFVEILEYLGRFSILVAVVIFLKVQPCMRQVNAI